mmetsp:Transcript_150844/g.484785  ORF Transcript_150844/g.484785 Transcript_150844/m.484785 type:complete len:245 (-) Transcript_150844:206-940(-)
MVQCSGDQGEAERKKSYDVLHWRHPMRESNCFDGPDWEKGGTIQHERNFPLQRWHRAVHEDLPEGRLLEGEELPLRPPPGAGPRSEVRARSSKGCRELVQRLQEALGLVPRRQDLCGSGVQDPCHRLRRLPDRRPEEDEMPAVRAGRQIRAAAAGAPSAREPRERDQQAEKNWIELKRASPPPRSARSRRTESPPRGSSSARSPWPWMPRAWRRRWRARSRCSSGSTIEKPASSMVRHLWSFQR